MSNLAEKSGKSNRYGVVNRPNQWQYNEYLETYLLGTEVDGGGVFQENNLWTGNVSFGFYMSGIPYFQTKEEAQLAVEKELSFLRKKLNSQKYSSNEVIK